MIVISFDPSSTLIILVHVYANDQALVKICVAAFIEYVRSVLCTAIYIAQTDRIMLAIAASPAADL